MRDEQKTEDKSFTDILIDTQHNSKAKELFLKLLAKQRKPVDNFNKVRSLTYNSIDILNSINEVE